MVVFSLQVPFRTLNEQKTRSAGYPAKQRICRNCSKNKQHPVIFKNFLQSRLAHEVCKNFCLFFSRQNCKKIFDG